MSDRSFATTAAILAIASLPLAVGNLLAMLATVHFNINGMTDPLVLLHAGVASAPLWRWSMILDIFGYYLPIVPLVLLLHRSLRPRGPSWIDLFAACLIGYCFVGAIGGAFLATALPTLIREYASTASVSDHANLRAVFTGYTDGIYRGLWNLLEEFLAGVGWIGLGLVLRADRWRLGALTIVLGTACLVDSSGTALNNDVIGSIGLSVYLILAPTWACLMGIDLIRARSPEATHDRPVLAVHSL
jgi:hypothetical protein